MKFNTVVNAILIAGSDDWIYLDEVVDAVIEVAPDLNGEALVDEVVAVIRVVVEAGLMEVGDIRDGFKPWPSDVETSLQRIRTEWQPPGRELTIGDICWLANTVEGDRVAKGAPPESGGNK